MYSISLKHWLLWFGVSILGLWYIVEEFGDWMANSRPPWADYMALMLGHLIGINKCPGLRPVGVGETWYMMLAKCMMVVTVAEANESCGTEHLCGGLESGIDGRVLCGAVPVSAAYPGVGMGVPPP